MQCPATCHFTPRAHLASRHHMHHTAWRSSGPTGRAALGAFPALSVLRVCAEVSSLRDVVMFLSRARGWHSRAQKLVSTTTALHRWSVPPCSPPFAATYCLVLWLRTSSARAECSLSADTPCACTCTRARLLLASTLCASRVIQVCHVSTTLRLT
eukprot:m.254816 g.254816  ORF g.254816 m.254816 type:complete len:155 (+) comp54540_c1_seq1:1348-1812(+)